MACPLLPFHPHTHAQTIAERQAAEAAEAQAEEEKQRRLEQRQQETRQLLVQTLAADAAAALAAASAAVARPKGTEEVDDIDTSGGCVGATQNVFVLVLFLETRGL